MRTRTRPHQYSLEGIDSMLVSAVQWPEPHPFGAKSEAWFDFQISKEPPKTEKGVRWWFFQSQRPACNFYGRLIKMTTDKARITFSLVKENGKWRSRLSQRLSTVKRGKWPNSSGSSSSLLLWECKEGTVEKGRRLGREHKRQLSIW